MAAADPGDVIGSLDAAMAKADITPANLNRLGENFKKLNTTVTNMNDISDVVAATGDDAKKVQGEIANLSTNLGRLNSIYGNMLSAMQGR